MPDECRSVEHLRAQSDALVPDYQVVAFERPGHGRSADVDEDFTYTRGVADTLAYLDAQGIDSAHVIGYSDGAVIGLLLALEHPERVRSYPGPTQPTRALCVAMAPAKPRQVRSRWRRETWEVGAEMQPDALG